MDNLIFFVIYIVICLLYSPRGVTAEIDGSGQSASVGTAALREGAVYRTLDDQQVITIVSANQLELTNNGTHLVCQYTLQGTKVRVVVTLLGTTQALYYVLTTQGLAGDGGVMLYEPSTYETLHRQKQLNQALLAAAQRGDTQGILGLLQQGARPVSDQLGRNALVLAYESGNDQAVIALLEHGADANIVADRGMNQTLLILAAERGKSAVVGTLLDHGASPEVRDVYGLTALMEAMDAPLMHGLFDAPVTHDNTPEYTKIVRLLIEHHANINARDTGQATALMRAVLNDNEKLFDIEKLLVAAGADRTLRNSNGKNVFDLATYKNLPEQLRILRTADENEKARLMGERIATYILGKWRSDEGTLLTFTPERAEASDTNGTIVYDWTSSDDIITFTSAGRFDYYLRIVDLTASEMTLERIENGVYEARQQHATKEGTTKGLTVAAHSPSEAARQTGERPAAPEKNTPEPIVTPRPTIAGEHAIKGHICNGEGIDVPNVAVFTTSGKNTRSDSEGMFRLDLNDEDLKGPEVQNGWVLVHVQAQGYVSQEMKFRLEKLPAEYETKPIVLWSPAEECAVAERDLNKAWSDLTSQQKSALRQGERSWIRMKESIPVDDPKRLKLIQQRREYLESLLKAPPQ